MSFVRSAESGSDRFPAGAAKEVVEVYVVCSDEGHGDTGTQCRCESAYGTRPSPQVGRRPCLTAWHLPSDLGLQNLQSATA